MKGGNTMKRLFVISTTVVLCSVFFFAVVCVAGEVTKPAHVRWSGTAYIVGGNPYCGSTQILVINTGEGLSSLSGKSTWLSAYCGAYTSPTTFEGEGWGIMTVANGDKAYADIEITIESGQFTEIETFIDGTGRFEGMSGITTTTGSIIDAPETFPVGTYPQVLENPANWEATSTGSLTFSH
jgi:hypothetical protein